MSDVTRLEARPAARFGTLAEWLAWQEKLHFTAIELGLDRCRRVAEIMGLLPAAYYVVSIAGTNGKGSCAAMLDRMLRSAGYRVGLYTSPHLLAYNERIRIDGHPARDQDLCEAFARIDRARGDISLTYFEFGTLAAMDLFQSRPVDIAVMEVGMGGRLDAVNMLDADVSLVTTIDLDHQRWLGPDRQAIGREKAGIFRSLRPAVCGDPDPPPSVMETAHVVGANLLRSGHDFHHARSRDGWSWRSGLARYERLPVPGGQDCQVRNAAAVLMVIEAMAARFPVPREAVCAALADFSLPGRFQTVPGDPELVLDVAHNAQAAAVLADQLEARPAKGRTLLVLGMLDDKDHRAFARALQGRVDSWYLAKLDDPRGATGTALAGAVAEVAGEGGYGAFDGVAAALGRARADARPGDRILVTGSFVTVAGAMRSLGLKV